MLNFFLIVALSLVTVVDHKPLPTRYDVTFKRHCRSIPVPFLRALAKNESNFNPSDANGPAWGLLQVVEVVRKEYNSRYGTDYSRQQLLNPYINVKIACSLLKRIVKLYEQWHPDVFPLDWSNKNHVALLVFGWNAGYSKAKGVGYVIRLLKERGQEVSVINVYRLAKATKHASRFLGMSGRLRWTMKVVNYYFYERNLQKS